MVPAVPLLRIENPLQSRLTLDAAIFTHAEPGSGPASCGAPARSVSRMYGPGCSIRRQDTRGSVWDSWKEMPSISNPLWLSSVIAESP